MTAAVAVMGVKTTGALTVQASEPARVEPSR
jgi:hypothetical protein